MKIRVIKGFAGYRVGQEFDWADGMARIYIGRGMVEEVREESRTHSPVIEEAAVQPRVEKAVMQSKRRQK